MSLPPSLPEAVQVNKAFNVMQRVHMEGLMERRSGGLLACSLQGTLITQSHVANTEEAKGISGDILRMSNWNSLD